MTTRARALSAALTATILLGSCGGEPTGPGVGLGQVALAPVFANATEASIVDVAFVRVRINEALRTDALIDTVIAWPATGDSLVIRLALPVTAEPYALRLAMANAQGDTVFRAGPTPVRASFNPRPDDVASPVLTYIGVGSNATGVRFVSPPANASFGQTVTITAEAFDGQNTVIAGTPIAFSLVNPADSVRARFPDRGIGSLVVGNVRGNVAIEARLLTGPSVTTTIAVQPVANGIVVVSGNTQTGTAGGALAQPLVARVRAADGLGVAGVPVAFSVLTGGGTLGTVIDTSDANGDVSSTLTLGLVAGAQTVRASVPSVPGAEVIFTANAVGGAATRLVILDEPNNTTAGTPVAAVVRVAIQDAGGNLVATATNPVAVAILNNPGGAGVLQGPASVNAVAGIATFNGLRIDQAAAGYTLRFTSGALASDTSQAFTVAPGAATALAFSTQPPLAATSNAPFTVAVRARDNFGNTQPSYANSMTVSIGTNPSAGTLAGTLTVSPVAGVATFTNLSINNVGAGYTLVANGAGLTAATSNAFDITVPAGINAWVNPAGGNWSTEANWSLGTVPTATDTVWIRQAGTYTVNVDQAVTVGRLLLGAASGVQTLSISANNLTMAESVFVAPTGVLALSGGSLLGAGALTVNGTFNWSGGSVAGVGGAIRVLQGATLNYSGTATRNLQDKTVEIGGTATWSSTGTLNTGAGAVLRVLPTGAMTVTSDATISYNLGGAASLFHNQGAVTRSTSTGAFTIGLPWENDGAMVVNTGTLTATSGSGTGTSGGSLQLAAGTTANFVTGTYEFDAASSVTGLGTLTVSGATMNVASGLNHAGPSNLSAGTLNLLGASNALTGFTFSGGTLGGAVGTTLTLNGTTTWSTGNIVSAGTVNVPSGATLNVTTAGSRNVQNVTLTIGGIANLTGGPTLNTGSAAILRVLAGGTLNLQSDASITNSLGGGAPLLQNLGTITRTTTAGIALLNLPFDNDGALTVSTGTLRLSGGLLADTWTGTANLAAGTTMELTGGTYNWNLSSLLSGTGTLSVTGATLNMSGIVAYGGPVTLAAGQLNFNGSAAINTLAFSGGTLGGTGDLTISQNFAWSSGNIAGTNTLSIPPASTLTYTGAGGRNLQERTITIGGTADFTGSGTLNTGQGAIIRILASGIANLSSDGTFANSLGGAAPLFHNQGTVRRNTTTGAWTIGMPVDNDGVIDIVTGLLRLGGGSGVDTWSGDVTVPAGTTLDFNAGTFALGAGSVVSGVGALSVTGGTVNVAEPWAYTGAASITNGALNYNATSGSIASIALSGGALGGGVGSSLSVPTAFTWSGTSTINRSGTLSIPVGSTLTIPDATTKTLQNVLLSIGGSLVYSGTNTMNTGQGAILRILAGATMTMSGAPTINFALGGAQSSIENFGTITKNTSAGTAVFSTSFVNSGVVNITTGQLDLSGASTLGGSVSVAATTTLRLNGGTATLQPLFAVTGLGETVVNAGVVTGLAVGDTANFARLRLLGGSLTHGGVVRSADYVEWAGATAINGPGGLTAVDTMVVSGTASRQLTGGALIEAYGVTLWSSTAAINSGNGARWRNMPTGDMTWSGDGSFLNNLGGASATLENRGILRFSGAGTTTVTAAIVDTVGLTFAVNSGTVAAGGGGRLGGGKTLNGFLDITAGVMTMRTGTNMASGTGGVRISGGTVTPDSAAAVTITRLDLQGGSLNHEANLTISSQLNWTGGTIQSNTVGLGGTTTMGAASTVNITGATARTASGTHLLSVPAGATVNHNATGIIGTGQGFTLQNSGTYNLQNVGGWAFSLGGTQPTFRNLTGANVIANGASTGGIAMRLDNAGGALTVTTDSLRFLLGSTGSLTGTATVNAGALVLGGGPFTMTGALTIAGTAADLVIDNAALTVGAQTLTVNGDLLTRNNGSVNSSNAASVVDVNGSAQFNGAQSIMSAGILRVAGNFTQGPTGVSNAFDASGTHRTVFDGAGAQSITFANPTLSRFNRVEFPTIGHTVTLQTNATVLDSLIMLGGGPGSADLVGAGTTQRLTVNGVLRMDFSTTSPSLSVPVVELSAVPAVAAISSPGRGFFPDTAVYLGAAITAIPTNAGYKYNNIRLTTGGAVQILSDTIQGQLHTTSSNVFFIGSVTHRMGKLRTSGTGTLTINSVDHNLTVVDSVIFGGGSTNGSLTAGTMTVGGNFVQAGGNTAAFAATGTFNTILNGTALQTVRFDNPGTTTTTSHFARFTVGNASPAGIRILSPVHAVTQLGSTFARPAISLVSSTTGDSLSAAGVQADSITFDNVPVRIVAGGTMTTFNVIRFQNMSPTATQLRITRPGPATSFNLNLFDFATTPTTGFYFSFNNTAVGAALPFAFTNTTPVSSGSIAGLYQRLGATPPTVTWNGQPLP